ncbi:MAG: hypothetical protein ACO1RA_05685 [Planctomycetaceae bacterium]
MNEAYELATAIKEVAETRLRLQKEMRDTNVYGAGLELLAFGVNSSWGGEYTLFDFRHRFSSTIPGMIRTVRMAAPFSFYWGCQIGRSDLLEMIKTASDYPIFYIYHNANLIGEIHQLALKRTPERALKLIWDTFWKTGWRSLWKLPGDRFEVFIDGQAFGSFQIPVYIDSRTAIFDLKLSDGRVLLLTGQTRAGWNVARQLNDEIAADKIIPTQNAKLSPRELQVYAAINIMVRVDLVDMDD